MNKAELVAAIATKTGASKKAAEASLNAIIESVEAIFMSSALIILFASRKTMGDDNAKQNGENEIKIVTPTKIAASAPF